MKEKIAAQKQKFNKLEENTLLVRINRLLALKRELKNFEKDIYQALFNDLHKDEWEVFVSELSIVNSELNHALKNVKRWMKPRRIKTSLSQIPGKNFVIAEPLGQVLIMSPWNYPLQLTIVPLIGALAAGNVVVIKPSSYAPHIAKVMEDIVNAAFPNGEVILFQGGREVNTEILTYRYDMIFFTGSPDVGKIVMKEASKFLTPVVLELGGKSPLIITPDINIDVTLRRLKFAKLMNNGQTCVAPDYVLLDQKMMHLIPLIEQAFTLNEEESSRMPKIINEKHFLRLKEYLDELNLSSYDVKSSVIRPTIVVNPPLSSKLMQEEIFGPILPIITYQTIDEAISFIQEREKPLALYLFTNNKAIKKGVLTRTSSGAVAINDALIQLANHSFPFGGVGSSGMGKYHGIYSFDVFSHNKAVLAKPFAFDIPFRYKKDKKTMKLLKKLLK